MFNCIKDDTLGPLPLPKAFGKCPLSLKNPEVYWGNLDKDKYRRWYINKKDIVMSLLTEEQSWPLNVVQEAVDIMGEGYFAKNPAYSLKLKPMSYLIRFLFGKCVMIDGKKYFNHEDIVKALSSSTFVGEINGFASKKIKSIHAYPSLWLQGTENEGTRVGLTFFLKEVQTVEDSKSISTTPIKDSEIPQEAKPKPKPKGKRKAVETLN